jgi:hypothetical protein
VAVFAFVWGSFQPIPLIHDEASYLLQAKLFAEGRWTAPARPLPRFFEQFYVLVTPVTASKYPAGQALTLAPGVAVGIPVLMPLLLAGLSGAFVFTLARDLAGTAAGTLTWFLWATSRGALRYEPTYLSEATTLFLWLAGWAALRRWRATRSPTTLCALAIAAAWCSITRPLTGLVFAVPAILVVLKERPREQTARRLALPALLGAAVTAILPVQNLHVTGNLWRTPYALYNRQYLPHDRPGFTVDETPPSRPLPPDLARFSRDLESLHRTFGWKSLPGILARRCAALAGDVWEGRWPLAAFFLAGLAVLPSEGWFALGTGALLVLAYLFHAHPASLTMYALEMQPVLCFGTAVGLVWAARKWMRLSHRGPAARWTLGLAAAALAGLGAVAVVNARWDRSAEAGEQKRFRDSLERLPPEPAVVFVRYAAGHGPSNSLVRNPPDLSRARFWIVYDRGEQNAQLLKLAGNRRAYVYEEAHHRMVRYNLAP